MAKKKAKRATKKMGAAKKKMAKKRPAKKAKKVAKKMAKKRAPAKKKKAAKRAASKASVKKKAAGKRAGKKQAHKKGGSAKKSAKAAMTKKKKAKAPPAKSAKKRAPVKKKGGPQAAPQIGTTSSPVAAAESQTLALPSAPDTRTPEAQHDLEAITQMSRHAAPENESADAEPPSHESADENSADERLTHAGWHEPAADAVEAHTHGAHEETGG